MFRAGVGSGICFQSETIPAILDFTEKFVEQFQFTGQVGFDFIVDKYQKVWVLEGNPRATSGLHLFESGSQLTDAFKETNYTLIEPDDSVSTQMIGAAMLSFGLRDAIKTRSLGRYIRELFRGKDVLFRWSDPLPSLSLPLTFGELCWIARRERMSLQQASTFDIEWNGEPL